MKEILKLPPAQKKTFLLFEILNKSPKLAFHFEITFFRVHLVTKVSLYFGNLRKILRF
jgi:hypothetical protein